MEHTKIIAIANQKGGVGKTTTTANLGTSLARQGKRVLLIDFDPQGSLSLSFGYQAEKAQTISTALNQIIVGEPAPDIVVHHQEEPIDLILSDISLAGVESTLVNVSLDREYVLKDYLEGFEHQYDYILIDCMPSLGALTINALVAADSVLIPVQANYLAAKGLEQLLSTVGKLRKRKNPNLKIEGIVLTMFDRRTNNAKDIAKTIQNAYQNSLRIFTTTIPRSVRVEESPSSGQSILLYDPTGKVADSYVALAEEVTA